jgi:hypothetical protein
MTFEILAARDIAAKLKLRYDSNSDVVRASLMLQGESLLSRACEEIEQLRARIAYEQSKILCDHCEKPIDSDRRAEVFEVICCECCNRDMDRGEPHTAECASALAQDGANA